MIKITNNTGISDVMHWFLSQDFYDGEEAKGTLSATTLLDPIRKIILKERYKDEITEESVDRLWSLYGSAVHAVLERAEGEIAGKKVVPIQRLYAKVFGEIISGKYDLILEDKLYDFKVTSAWSIAYKSKYKDYATQLSIYRWLYWKSKGIELNKKGHILAILRDWNKSNLIKKGYPKTPIVEIKIDLIPFSIIEDQIKNRVVQIQNQRKLEEKDIQECTDSERWLNFKTGKNMRCENYCNVSKFCSQFKNIKLNEKENNIDIEMTKKEKIHKVIQSFKMLKGFYLDDKDWDTRNYARCIKTAPKLLALFSSDLKQTITYMEKASFRLKSKKLSWEIETLYKIYDSYTKGDI